MDVAKCLAVLAVLCLKGGETGGGGGKHHDHVRIHIPEFIHHDHHKKVITIHHHHHKPKKETHHHHHHHHKPQIPYGHHYHHHHKKVATKTLTETKGSKHGHHHAKHGHHGHKVHHGHHGHHGHSHHGQHHEAPVVPSYSYSPSSVPSYEDDYSPSYSSSYSPSVPAYGGGYGISDYSSPQSPRVHGVTHTVKQVKVFDSLPGALPSNGGSAGHGYEVKEEGEDEDDVFTTVNQLQNRFPATFGYVRSAAPEPTNDPYSELTSQAALPTHFAASPVPTTALSGGLESFSTAHSDPFASSAPTQSISLPSVQPSGDYPVSFQSDGFDGHLNSFTGSDGTEGSYISNEDNSLNDETPVSFAREAGIQQTTNTGNVETIEY
ncbi:hypothetical protein PYW08_000381 [Mythimna loreyi]|uniref:Uncharacterized protein n=1 Tax=Mythimna loreyi TaxID=667449 RepID=A0ACC2RCE9_9NEOP|nr:hypothetical protein PYW08_000381 [Mythimna loreyi]